MNDDKSLEGLAALIEAGEWKQYSCSVEMSMEAWSKPLDGRPAELLETAIANLQYDCERRLIEELFGIHPAERLWLWYRFPERPWWRNLNLLFRIRCWISNLFSREGDWE